MLLYVGEKYELAKKVKMIKLVNHRWLEDWYVDVLFILLCFFFFFFSVNTDVKYTIS
jgi:hypothetical protein